MRSAVKLYRVHEVLEITGITRQALRTYEEVGIVSSAPAEEDEKFYPEEVLETVRRVQRLREELGVNLPGVQVILEMRRKIIELQQSLEEVVQFVQRDLRQELEQYLRREEKAVVPKDLVGPPRRREE